MPLVYQNGSLGRYNGGLAEPDCCCPGEVVPDCDTCPCCRCTPVSWLVTLSGFVNPVPPGACTDCATINGAWSMTQTADPCVWRYDNPDYDPIGGICLFEYVELRITCTNFWPSIGATVFYDLAVVHNIGGTTYQASEIRTDDTCIESKTLDKDPFAVSACTGDPTASIVPSGENCCNE